MEIKEMTIKMIREHLPTQGTELSCYTFLASDALWTGTVESQRPFVTVAEDNWPSGGGPIIVVMEDGPVHIAWLTDDDVANPDYRGALDLEQESLIDYCAADFPKFMEIMKLFMEAMETISRPGFASDDDEYEEECAKIEQVLRQQAAKIDPTAIEDPDSLWSTLMEELGAGML